MHKLLLALVFVGSAALGAWAYATNSPAVLTSFRMTAKGVMVTVMGANLILSIWVWLRAKPGSGDAMVSPTLMFLPAAMLVGWVPGLIWPEAERTASLVSLVMVISLLVKQVRDRRRLHATTAPRT